MEYFDNILCVTYKELLDIMPKGTLNSQLSREKLDVVSRGGGENNPALYAYSSPRNTRNVGLSVMANPRNK